MKNKNIFYTVIISIVIICIAYLYAHIDKMSVIYDKDVDTSEYMATGVIEEGVIEQTFVATEDSIDGMYVKCQIFGDVSEVVLKYNLLEKDSGEVAAEGIISAKDLNSNLFTKLFFDEKVTGCKDKGYVFEIWEENAAAGQGVGFCYEQKIEKETKLVIAGEEKNGTLIAKTITKRFDVETFIVLISFVLFISAFIRVLYKLFK